MPPAAKQSKKQAEASAPDDASLAKELLVAGVPLSRVEELFRGRVDERDLNAIARKAVAESGAGTDLGLLVLQRSTTAARDPAFVSGHVASLTADAPEELLDPLFSTLMRDPVVISSGYILDRSSVLDGRGQLKFRTCPFTRASLKSDVYPLVEKRGKLQEFKEKRLDAMTGTARTLFAEKNFAQFDEVMAAAEAFLDDLGEEIYIHWTRKLAELRMAAAELPDREVTPGELASIYIRIHRTVQSEEAAQFRQKVQTLEEGARRALAEGRLDDACQWCDACERVKRACGIQLPVAQLRLELAKKQGVDLKVPRQCAFREIREDPVAAERFLVAEGLNVNDVRDLRPVLLCKTRVDDYTMDDEWHSAMQSPPLEGGVSRVWIAVGGFRDQGWGNWKGNLGLALYDGDGTLIARCNLFGTYRSDGYNHGDQPSRTLGSQEEVVARARPGCTYRLEYTVGGGGGHSLHVQQWTCMIVPSGWPVETVVSYHMEDPEGDAGEYAGAANADGRAHGLGQLVYAGRTSTVFVGEFASGSMVEGVVYVNARAQITMKSGHWTDPLDRALAEKFSQQLIIAIDDGATEQEEEDDESDDDYEEEDE